MKILFISTTFPDATSPARGTYNAALCGELAREHQVHVIAPRTFSEAVPFYLKGNRYKASQESSACGIAVDYPTYWYTPKFLQHRYGDQMWWSVRRCATEIVDRFVPDVVLSYWAHPEGEVGTRIAQFAGVPSAVIVGGTDVLVLPKEPRRGARVQDVLVQSSAVISVSDGLRNAVIDLGIAPERIHTIYQGIDPTRFHTGSGRDDARRTLGLSPDVRHLVWVGRMVPIKAINVLLDAVALLRDRDIPVQLHLIGDGPLKPALQAEANQKGLSEWIHFAGSLAHDDLPEWYRAADVTVLSSDSEGLPNVLRESLACGTPFVCTDVGSVREIARPEYSALAPRRDPQALADAIAKMLNPTCTEAALTYAPRTWKDCARETVQLLSQLQVQPHDVRSTKPPMTTTSIAGSIQ